MDIIVFGDDWRAHISTTQHLINHLPKTDRVFWFNSIGMRAPTISYYDFHRVIKKAIRLITALKKKKLSHNSESVTVLQPHILPFHKLSWVRWINQRLVTRQLRQLIKTYGLKHPVILTANPVVTDYIPEEIQKAIHYIRLDNYALYGGVDQQLAIAAEKKTFLEARHVFYTARELVPSSDCAVSSSYLPQGVDISNFKVHKVPQSGDKTLGFFGLIEESRFDFELIEQVAEKNPDWRFEFLGQVNYRPKCLLNFDNIIWREAVDYKDLSRATAHWHAAWIPYNVNMLTNAINPLKVREYLAMGLPVLSTRLPEVLALDNDIQLIQMSKDVTRYLDWVMSDDSNIKRQQRRDSVLKDSWYRRSCELREQLVHS